MRKLFYLLILLALGAAGVHYSGFYSRLPLDGITRRGVEQGKGQEFNTRGVAELNAGKPEEAVLALREAARLEPGNSVIERNLSIALARHANDLSGDEQTALRLLDESLRIWPRNPEALDGLSSIHFRAARFPEALEPALVLEEMMPDREDLVRYVGYLRSKVADEEGMSAEEGDRFRLLYSDERRLEYEGELVSILQSELDSLSASLGIFPDKPIDVLLLTEDLGKRADPLDGFLEGLYDGQIRLYLGAGIEDRDKLMRTVRHEMVHALLHQAVGILPGWVQEGMAQTVGEEPTSEELARTRKYLAAQIGEGYAVDLSSMGMTFINMDTESRTKAYAASQLFMVYLTGHYGSGFTSRFVAELASGTGAGPALKSLTGRELKDLQERFAADLSKEN